MSLVRFRKKLARSKLLGSLITIAFVLLLPIILPVALIQDQIRTRKIKRIICAFVCASCGTRLGTEAIRLGNERWAAIVSDLHARFPDRKLRVLRDVHAVCPNCGREYMYRDADRSLVFRPQHEQA